VENPPLARALYKQVDLGREIPADLYEAVAEVLAFVFQINQKRRERLGMSRNTG
jgi:flagellar biosynthetic protein FlhB